MNNREKLKKYLAAALIFAIVFLSVFLALNVCEYRVYNANYNRKIGAVIAALREKYDDITEKELIGILNGEAEGGREFLMKYGIDVENGSAINENERAHRLFLIIGSGVLLSCFAVFLIIFIKHDNARSKEIAEITAMLERINKRDYDLNMDSTSEDELSILRSEIYKTTITLREAADSSQKDKTDLKKALEDISHQLKTPLTGILIMLDNIIDDPGMDPGVRDDFIHSIRREAVNINYFVRTILKLSRFDSDTIVFVRENALVRDIVDDAARNVAALCDLRGITMDIEGEYDHEIICDRKWQTEAITNILKNSVEHSYDGGKVTIRCGRNNICTEIEIADRGEGIPAKDVPHVFERFYRGENASPEGTGIGLALSRSIIERDGGAVTVESGGEGTVFKIKYFSL